jgi:hypothetical protein
MGKTVQVLRRADNLVRVSLSLASRRVICYCKFSSRIFVGTELRVY